MSRIHEAFENKKAFIPFITCGDPDLETTAAIVKAMVHNGADLIELGIPFSDPTAEGPVIQEADNRALKGGVNTEKILAFARELRKDVKVPMVFMTYANVVYSYGAEKFLAAAKEAEIDGLILPDGSDFHDRPDLKGAHPHDRQRGEGIPLCGFLAWRHRRQESDQYRYRFPDQRGQGSD